MRVLLIGYVLAFGSFIFLFTVVGWRTFTAALRFRARRIALQKGVVQSTTPSFVANSIGNLVMLVCGVVICSFCFRIAKVMRSDLAGLAIWIVGSAVVGAGFASQFRARFAGAVFGFYFGVISGFIAYLGILSYLVTSIQAP